MDQRLTSPRRFTLAGSIRVFLAESLLLPTGFLVIAILTRWLGAEQYGLYVLAISIVSWLEWTLNSVLTNSSILVSSSSENSDGTSQMILRVYLLAGLAVGLLLFLASNSIALIFDEPGLGFLLRVLSIDIPLFAFARAYRAIWIGTGNYYKRATMSIWRWVVRLVLVVLLVFGGFSLAGAVVANIGATLFEAGYAFFNQRINPLRKTSGLPEMFYSVIKPLALYVVVMRLFSSLDLLSLRALGASIQDVGFYGAAQNLAVIPGIITLSYSPLLLSTLNKVRSQGNLKSAKSISMDALRLAVCLLPFAALVAGSSNEIVGIMLGGDFIASAPLLQLLIFAAVFQTSFSIAGIILIAAQKSSQIAKLALVLLFSSVVAYALLVPRFGPISAAWTITLMTLFASISGIYLVRKYLDILPPLPTLARAVLFSILFGLLSVVWVSNGGWILVKFAILSVLVLLSFYLTGELSTTEKTQLQKLLVSTFTKAK